MNKPLADSFRNYKTSQRCYIFIKFLINKKVGEELS